MKYTRIGDESDTQSFWVETDLTMTPAADGHTHKYGTEWKYDETNHWHECECGNKADITAHTFKQIIDKEATATEKGSKHEECTVCGYKKLPLTFRKLILTTTTTVRNGSMMKQIIGTNVNAATRLT